MRDKLKAVDKWFGEHRRIGSVIALITTLFVLRYLGEVIAVFLSGRPYDFSLWWPGGLLTRENMIGWGIAAIALLAFYALVKYLFKRWVRGS